MDTTELKARLLIGEIKRAMDRGTIHYEPGTGLRLNTVKEVLVSLNKHGRVEYQPAQKPVCVEGA